MKWVEIVKDEWVNMDRVIAAFVKNDQPVIVMIGADDWKLNSIRFDTREQAESRLREIMAEVQS